MKTAVGISEPEGDRWYQGECLDCGWLGKWRPSRERADADVEEHVAEEHS